MADEKVKLLPEIEQLTEKLLADPKSRVFAQLADAYRKCGMFDEAIDTAKRGLEVHPHYAVAHLILGRCYMAKKMYALAREEFELTVRNDPQNLVGFKLLAETYERQNMYPEAVKYYQMVLDLEPTNFDIAEKVDNLKASLKPVTAPKPAPPQPEPPKAPEPSPEPTPAPEAVSEPAVEVKVAEPEVTPAPEPAKAEPPSEPLVIEQIPEVLQGLQPEPEEKPAPAEAAPAAPDAPLAATTAEEPAKETPAGSTATLAELYATQGHYEKAVEAYRELIAAEPENQAYKERMDELIAKAFPDEEPAKPEPEAPAPVPVKEEKPAEEQAVELTDMFAEMERLAAPAAAEPAKPDAPGPLESAVTPAEKDASSQPAPVAEVRLPDLGALFADDKPEATPPAPPQLEAKQEPATPPAEPEAPPPAATAAEEPQENAVSSFQSWLNSIQK